MSRFNFIEITRNSVADILDVVNNFNKVESTGAIIDDLPKVYNITIKVANWSKVGNYWETTISNANIKTEPYIIEVFFDNLTIIKAPINPKPNSQSNGSIKLITTVKPTQALGAKLIIMRGVTE